MINSLYGINDGVQVFLESNKNTNDITKILFILIIMKYRDK